MTVRRRLVACSLHLPPWLHILACLISLSSIACALRRVGRREDVARLTENLAVPAALVAGCMPVYLGTPDIRPFLPHPDAALVYTDAEQVSAEMLRLMNDTADYDRRVRRSPPWRPSASILDGQVQSPMLSGGHWSSGSGGVINSDIELIESWIERCHCAL